MYIPKSYTDKSISDIVSAITKIGTVFDAKPSFPSDSGTILNDFLEYFKKTTQIINIEFSKEISNFEIFNNKLKKKLFIA